MKKNTPIWLLLGIYLFLALTTLMVWNRADKNSVDGDEHHYLVIASGIGKHGSLEQTAPYKEEFQTKEIYKRGLASPDATPTFENTHATPGPHGLFNIHNIGLPLILSLPFLLAGVIGAKLFMIFLGGFVIVVAWNISSIFSTNQTSRFLATLATCIALPLIPASNQIYPDMLAGTVSLSAIYWFLTTNKKRSVLREGVWISAIVFLPWLQLKFAPTCVLLVVAIALKIFFESKDLKRVLIIFSVALFSCAALAAYNHYAFGTIFGPYSSNALEFSKTSLMVLLGLHFDQNQGFLFQNPLGLVGLASIGVLFARNKPTALLWVLVFLSLIVPNAMHHNWYGGWSFSGRFGWSAAMVFILPTLFGLLKLADFSTKAFKVVIGFSLLLQFYFFIHYTWSPVSLFNKAASTWFDSYSMYYFPIHSWMPALYNSDWAYGYAPNYAWLIFISLLFVAGFASADKLKTRISSALTVGVLIVFVSGFLVKGESHHVVFAVKDLQSQTGRANGLVRVAAQGTDKAGFLNFGPYLPLRQGKFQLEVSYSSPASGEQIIGSFDVLDSTRGRQISKFDLHGTEGKLQVLKVPFEANSWHSHLYEFRNFWNGISEIQIHEIDLKSL
jgi:hypothetical protein